VEFDRNKADLRAAPGVGPDQGDGLGNLGGGQRLQRVQRRGVMPQIGKRGFSNHQDLPSICFKT